MYTPYLDFAPEMMAYNFDTGEFVSKAEPITDEQALTMLPPGIPRALYPLYRHEGQSIYEALNNVLERCV